MARTSRKMLLAAHTELKYSWVGEHGIISSAYADMAYQYGTLQVSYYSRNDGERHELRAGASAGVLST